MEFHFLFQLLFMICLGSYLQKVASVPVSNSTTFIQDATTPSALSDYFEFRLGAGRDNRIIKAMTGESSGGLLKDRLSNGSDNNSVAADIPETVARKKHAVENPLSTSLVSYVCDIGKEMCWLNLNQENLVTFFIPIKLLPNKQPPAQMGLKEFYSLVSKKKEQRMDNFGSTDLSSTVLDHNGISDVHPRKKRDTQYVEDSINPQNDWSNEGEYESNQSPRVQRNVPSTSTEQVTTSTEDRTQRNATGKQSKRSAEMDDDEVEDADSNSPPPDEDYQDENDMDYHPEKRFAGPETTETPQKFGDSPTKLPSQPIRRAAVNPNYNYPYFVSPDYFYPSQRMLSPFDGISYRSVDAFPMMYMEPNPVFWQTKFGRSPQQYFQQRQSPGYGRGWPMSSYYKSYGNRYPSTFSNAGQQNRGHYNRQYKQQQSHRPFSYGYGQGNRNYKAPARKLIETDANMYYGK